MTAAGKIIAFGITLGTLLAISACNFEYNKAGADSQSFGQENAVGYDQINAALFKPKCVGCHTNKEPILTSYEQIVDAIDDIQDAVLVKHTMPKRGTLSPDLQAMLRNWIAAGMPREGTAPVPPTTSRGKIPRPYTYANLKADVLDSKCITCHATANSDGNTPLDTYAGIMSAREWIVPLTMGMLDSVPVPAEDRMPPEKSEQLTEEDQSRILFWFADGNRDEKGVPAPSASPSPSPSSEPSPLPSAKP